MASKNSFLKTCSFLLATTFLVHCGSGGEFQNEGGVGAQGGPGGGTSDPNVPGGGDPLAASKMLAELRQGEPHFVSFPGNQLYLMRFDPAALTVEMKNVRVLGDSRFSNGENFLRGEFMAFGTRVFITEMGKELCVNLATAPHVCYARVLSSRKVETLHADAVLEAKGQVREQIGDLLANKTSPTQELKCDSDGDGVLDRALPKKHQILRGLSENILYGSHLQLMLTTADAALDYQGTMKEAVNYILNAYRDPLEDLSLKCDGKWKFHTATFVIQALFKYYEVTQSQEVRSYVLRTWELMLRSGQIDIVGSIFGDPTKDMSPVDFAQYMTVTLIAGQLGWDGRLAWFMFKGIERMFYSQLTNVSQAMCRVEQELGQGQEIPMLFGGFNPQNETCTQRLDQHTLIMAGFAEMKKYLEDKRSCEVRDENWASACRNLNKSLSGGLAFLANMMNTKIPGALFGISPFSPVADLENEPMTGLGSALMYQMMNQSPGEFGQKIQRGFDGRQIGIDEMEQNASSAFHFAFGEKTDAWRATGLFMENLLMKKGAAKIWSDR